MRLALVGVLAILALAVVQCPRQQPAAPTSMPYRTYIPVVTIGLPGGW